MSEEYRVVRSEHGVHVEGSIPVSDIAALSHVWDEHGWDLADCRIAEKLGASWVQTSKTGSVAWRRELGIT